MAKPKAGADSSYTSFLRALVLFLIFLCVIYLLLIFTSARNKDINEEAEYYENYKQPKQYEAIQGIDVYTTESDHSLERATYFTKNIPFGMEPSELPTTTYKTFNNLFGDHYNDYNDVLSSEIAKDDSVTTNRYENVHLSRETEIYIEEDEEESAAPAVINSFEIDENNSFQTTSMPYEEYDDRSIFIEHIPIVPQSPTADSITTATTVSVSLSENLSGNNVSNDGMPQSILADYTSTTTKKDVDSNVVFESKAAPTRSEEYNDRSMFTEHIPIIVIIPQSSTADPKTTSTTISESYEIPEDSFINNDSDYDKPPWMESTPNEDYVDAKDEQMNNISSTPPASYEMKKGNSLLATTNTDQQYTDYEELPESIISGESINSSMSISSTTTEKNVDEDNMRSDYKYNSPNTTNDDSKVTLVNYTDPTNPTIALHESSVTPATYPDATSSEIFASGPEDDVSETWYSDIGIDEDTSIGADNWIFSTIFSQTATVSIDDLLEMQSSESDFLTSTSTESKLQKRSPAEGELEDSSSKKTTTVSHESKDLLKHDQRKWEKSSLIFPTFASKSLSYMNHFADPCENFYDFSCANFVDSKENAKYENMERILNVLKEERNESYFLVFQDFYNSCLKYDFNADDIFLANRANSLTEALAKSTLMQFNNFFTVDVDVDKDFTNISIKFVLQLLPPHLNSDNNRIRNSNILKNMQKLCLEEQTAAASNVKVDLNEIYSSFENCLKLSQEILYKQDGIENIVDLLGDQSLVNSYRLDYINKKYHPITIVQLRTWCRSIDWQNFFKLITGRTMDYSETIQVYSVEYFEKLFKILCSEINETTLIGNIERSDSLQLSYSLKEKGDNRNIYCMDLSEFVMPEISHLLYYSKKTEIELNKKYKKIENLFRKLKSQFRESLSKGNITEKYDEFQQKLQNIKMTFLKPTDIVTLQNIALQNYEKYTEVQSLAYPQKLTWLINNKNKHFYSLKNMEATDFLLSTYFVEDDLPKAYYHAQSIVVPRKIFDKRSVYVPEFIVTSTIGLHLARELTRHFDLVGKNIDIPDATDIRNIYKFLATEMAERNMRNNYSRKFGWKTLVYELNGYLSANERMNDNTAFKLIYDYFMANEKEELPWMSDTYSPEQIFFIAVAQEYCKKITTVDLMLQIFERELLPATHRVENIIQNSKQFPSVFSCAGGTEMNPPNEKIQFPFIDKLIPEDYYISYDSDSNLYNK